MNEDIFKIMKTGRTAAVVGRSNGNCCFVQNVHIFGKKIYKIEIIDQMLP